jgi:hypothetical protein
MKIEDIAVFIGLAVCATALGVAANRQAVRLGLPAAAVPIVGAVVLTAIGGPSGRRR